MEKFREGLKKRLISYIVALVVAVVIIIVTFMRFLMDDSPGHMESFMSGFQFGLFATGMVIALLNIYSCIKAMKSNLACKKLYIKTKDERTKAIWSKSVTTGFLVTMYTLLVATIVAGFYNTIVFVTLLSVLLLMLAVTGVCRVIYFNIM